MFELRPEGNLVAISVPFPAEGLPMPAIADWPESGVALVSTRAGLFSLNANLDFVPVGTALVVTGNNLKVKFLVRIFA
jgi:hypothetical protein